MKKQNWFLSLILVMALMLTLTIPVSADETRTSVVSATVSTPEYIYSVTIPATIVLKTPPSIINAASSDAFSISLYTNDTVSHYVRIRVRGEDGQLSTAPNTNVLTPALQINSAALGWNALEITNTDCTDSIRLDVNNPAQQVTDVVITQPVVTSPTFIPAGTYQESLTFVVSFVN